MVKNLPANARDTGLIQDDPTCCRTTKSVHHCWTYAPEPRNRNCWGLVPQLLGSPSGSARKESACNAGEQAWSLGLEDPLEKEIATHSSILAWEIPWTEEPGGPQSVGSQRVGHNWATCIWIYGHSTEAHTHTVHAPQQEKPPRWEGYATKLGSSPHLLQLEEKNV